LIRANLGNNRTELPITDRVLLLVDDLDSVICSLGLKTCRQ
jgi:hypothetical protein